MTPEQILKIAKESGLLDKVETPYGDFYDFSDEEIVNFAKALQGDGEPYAWILETGHGTQFRTIKPQCEINYWKPLFTYPPDQTTKIKALEESELVLSNNVTKLYEEIANLQKQNDVMREALESARRGLASASLMNETYKIEYDEVDNVLATVKGE